MWFGIVEKPHPSLILGAYHFSLLFQPTVIPVKALEVMISATLKCFFSFFLLCAPCSSTYYRRTDPAVKLTAEPAPSVGRCAINRVVCTTNRSLFCLFPPWLRVLHEQSSTAVWDWRWKSGLSLLVTRSLSSSWVGPTSVDTASTFPTPPPSTQVIHTCVLCL